MDNNKRLQEIPFPVEITGCDYGVFHFEHYTSIQFKDKVICQIYNNSDVHWSKDGETFLRHPARGLGFGFTIMNKYHVTAGKKLFIEMRSI